MAALSCSASYNQGCVSVTPLHDGLPGRKLITVVEGLEGCHSANISPDNRTLWVPALKQDRICLFAPSATMVSSRHRSPRK